jgi:hypothetical protein
VTTAVKDTVSLKTAVGVEDEIWIMVGTGEGVSRASRTSRCGDRAAAGPASAPGPGRSGDGVDLTARPPDTDEREHQLVSSACVPAGRPAIDFE